MSRKFTILSIIAGISAGFSGGVGCFGPTLINPHTDLGGSADASAATASGSSSAPAITVAAQTGTWGTVFSYTPVTTGTFTSCDLSSDSAPLPQGLSLNSTTCVISGTPLASLTTQNTFYLVLTTSGGSVKSDAFTLTIPAPALTLSTRSSTVLIGSAITAITLTVSDFGGISTYSIDGATSLPTGLTLASTGNTTASITGTPTSAASNTYTILAKDEAGNTLASTTLSLTAAAAPSLTISTQEYSFGSGVSAPSAITGTCETGSTLSSNVTLDSSNYFSNSQTECTSGTWSFVYGAPTAQSSILTITATKNGFTTSKSFTVTYCSALSVLPVPAGYESGDGSLATPYVIATVAQLLKVSADAGAITGQYFKLKNDLDLSCLNWM